MILKPRQLLALATFLLFSCTATKPLAPAKTKVDVPKLVQPVSNIDVVVTVDLKSYIVQTENSVPTKYSDNRQPCEGLRHFYTFARTPFTITGSNNVLKIKFVVERTGNKVNASFANDELLDYSLISGNPATVYPLMILSMPGGAFFLALN